MKHALRYIPLGDAVIERAWPRLGATVGIAALLALLPALLGFEHRLINVVLFVVTYTVLALGLNVVVGMTGLLDLGYVTFLATGAILTMKLLLMGYCTWDGGYLLLIAGSGAVCALLGVLRGIPTLRLTGDYYAIVTLGIAEIVYLVYLNQEELTGGAFGMKLSLSSRPTLLGDKLYHDTWQFYFLVLAVLGLTLVVMDRLERSRIGRAWAAIRLDEVAARACGVDVSRYKMLAFAISGFVGGVGGALYAIWLGTVAAKALDIWQSILVLCAVVLGGMGSLRGVLLGSAILFSLREVLREEIPLIGARVPPEASFLVYGLLLVVVMRFRPQGLLPRGQGESTPMSPEEEQELRQSQPRLYALEERA